MRSDDSVLGNHSPVDYGLAVTAATQNVLDQAMRLNEQERAELALQLLDSLGESHDGLEDHSTEEELRQTIGQRVRSIKTGAEAGVSFEEALAIARADLK